MKFATALAFSDPRHFTDMARTADETGWDYFALSDHVFFPKDLKSAYPYVEGGKPYWDPTTPWPDPFVAVASMAAVTERLEFFTNVFILPARNPLLVAKTVGTLAVMSSNRFALGIGVGWMEEEFDLLDQKFSARGKRTDEQIEVMRLLASGEMVEHHGDNYDFPLLQMSPMPSQPVPVYVGGLSKPALRRAARLGNGWISVRHTSEEISDYIGRINELRAHYGRENDPFEFIVSATDAFDLDGYRRLGDIGVTTIITQPWIFYGGDPTVLVDKQEGLKRFAGDIIERMK